METPTLAAAKSQVMPSKKDPREFMKLLDKKIAASFWF
jgi:hypothetical protein